MKNLLSILIAVLVLCGAVSRAGAAQGRVDTRVLAGVTVSLQDIYTRDHVPVIITTNAAVYLPTNTSEGLYFFGPTNPVFTAYTFSLPNPTNNVGRKFTFHPVGASFLYLSNGLGGGIKAAISNTVNTVYGVQSNSMAIAYSTGTNWFVWSSSTNRLN